MADPPSRTTSNGQKMVLVNPLDRRVTEEERQALSLEEFRSIEDELMQESAAIIQGALRFNQIERDHEGDPPPEWEAELERAGMSPYLARKRAREMLRMAKAAWCNQKEAPVGLKMAQATFIGIARVRHGDQLIPQHYNIGHVVLVQAPEVLEVKELEGE